MPRPLDAAPGPVALCLLLVLAGCQVGYGGPATAEPAAPTPTASPTPDGGAPTPTEASPGGNGSTGTPGALGVGTVGNDSDGIDVRGASLPVNPDVVYYRTRALLNVDVGPPAAVVVRNLSTAAVGSDPRRFFRLMGLAADARANDSDVGVAAFVAGPDRVTINERIVADAAALEATLAHEYAHIVQFRTRAVPRVRSLAGATVDGRTASRALIEGAATFTADAYWRAHMTNGTRPAVEAARLHENASGGGRYVVAPYRFGYEYVAARIDRPAALPRVYDDPPVTTEQLLHPGTSEPAGEIATGVNETDAWLYVPGERRMGELFVRTALDAELDRSRAVGAAAGWGTDARLDFVGRDDRAGFVWLLRFDDGANATEFARAFAGFGDARAAAVDAAFRQRRLSERTVAVLAGAPAFVDGATVERENGTVAVAAPYASSSGRPKTTAAPISAITNPTATCPLV